MTAFLLRGEDIQRLWEQCERAKQMPLPLEYLRSHAMEEKTVIGLQDRAGQQPRPPSAHVELPLGYRVAMSFEQQPEPAGLCLHLSMSAPKAGRVPSPEAVLLVLDELGYDIKNGRMWLEEFDPGHHAVNVVIPESTRKCYVR